MRTIVIVSVLLALQLALTQGLGAKESTVLSVSGEAWQSRNKTKWDQLAMGDKLGEGTWIKTEIGASVRLIRSTGSMYRVSGGNEEQITSGRSQSASSNRGVFAVMSEMFSGLKRTRMAASRGEDDPEAQVAKYFDDEWNTIIHKSRLYDDEIAQVLEVAAFYTNPPLNNRSVALVSKLAHNFPDNAGFVQLAARARQEFKSTATLYINKRQGNQVSPLLSGGTIRSGDGLQIEFKSKSESFLYLYLRTTPERGAATTVLVYPDNLTNPGGSTPDHFLTLPGTGAFYPMDDTKGHETIFAWACVGPVSDRQALNRAAKAVSGKIAGNGEISRKAVMAAAPSQCTGSFAYNFRHQ